MQAQFLFFWFGVLLVFGGLPLIIAQLAFPQRKRRSSFLLWQFRRFFLMMYRIIFGFEPELLKVVDEFVGEFGEERRGVDTEGDGSVIPWSSALCGQTFSLVDEDKDDFDYLAWLEITRQIGREDAVKVRHIASVDTARQVGDCRTIMCLSTEKKRDANVKLVSLVSSRHVTRPYTMMYETNLLDLAKWRFVIGRTTCTNEQLEQLLRPVGMLSIPGSMHGDVIDGTIEMYRLEEARYAATQHFRFRSPSA